MSWPIRVFAAALASVTVLTVAGCDALPGRPDVTKREVVPVEVTAFDALYRRNCAGCHGTDGRLGAARPLNDPVYLALVPADRLRTIIREGVPGSSMPAFGIGAGGELTDAQVEALAQGMLARWSRPETVRGVTLPPYGAPPGASDPGVQERGAAVYVRACAQCHGPGGRGGGPFRGTDIEAELPVTLEEVMRGGKRRITLPGNRNLDVTIPGQDLPDSIQAFVVHVAPNRGVGLQFIGASDVFRAHLEEYLGILSR